MCLQPLKILKGFIESRKQCMCFTGRVLYLQHTLEPVVRLFVKMPIAVVKVQTLMEIGSWALPEVTPFNSQQVD